MRSNQFALNPKGFTWYVRVKEYTFLLPNFEKVVAVLERRQEILQKLLGDLISSSPEDETGFKAIKLGIENLVVQQAKLFNQFYSHFQLNALR